MITVFPPSTKFRVSVVVPVTVPAQASVVVGAVSVPLQSTVTELSVGVIGSVVSSTVTTAIQVSV